MYSLLLGSNREYPGKRSATSECGKHGHSRRGVDVVCESSVFAWHTGIGSAGILGGLESLGVDLLESVAVGLGDVCGETSVIVVVVVVVVAVVVGSGITNTGSR
jgi:hypothetical protein